MAVLRRNTRQRQMVLTEIQSREGHFTADELYARMRVKDSHISRGTVYRNLQLLAEEGAIRRVRMPNRSDCYERNLAEHDHLLCRECGRLIDVGPLQSRVDQQVSRRSGYTEIRHSFLFSGICPDCQKKHKA